MQGDRVPETDHISRYCRGSSIDEDGWIDGSAFSLRENEDYLSVNWLECLGLASEDEAIFAIRGLVRRRLNLGTTERFAVIQTGPLAEFVRGETADRELRVLHEPLDDEEEDPTHSGIHGMRPDPEIIRDLIADFANNSARTYPAKPQE